MARYSRAWLTLLLLACALVQSSYGSRPSPRELQMAGVLSPTMVHGAVVVEPCRADDGAVGTNPPATNAEKPSDDERRTEVEDDEQKHSSADERPGRRTTWATIVRPSTEEGATGHHGANAADGGAVAASAMGGAGVVSSEQRKGSGVPVLQLALKLARWVLGGEAEDSAAGPSCHSNNAHITCAPPTQH